MKPSILKLWVRALRSGKYKQACNYLHTPRGYCCLGVLCDLYLKKTGKGKWELSAGGTCFQFVEQESSLHAYYRESSVLPDSVMRWARLNIPTVELRSETSEGGGLEVTDLNDGDPDRGLKRHNFKQIADALLKAAKARTLR